MKPILKIKIAVDAAMSVSMLLLMAYGLVGEAAHEWIGMGMFALFVAHHILNESGCWQSERANTRPSAWFRRRWSESSFFLCPVQ